MGGVAEAVIWLFGCRAAVELATGIHTEGSESLAPDARLSVALCDPVISI